MRKVVFIHAAGRLAEGSGPLVAYLEDELGAGFEVTAPEMPNPDGPEGRGMGGRGGRAACRPAVARKITWHGPQVQMAANFNGFTAQPN